MIIKRILEKKAKELTKKFPIVAITGPRQSGKTTLVKYMFPNLPYVSLEDLDIRSFAEEDPRGFLSNYQNGVIFDEIQRVPALFSYLQKIVDEKKKNGQFILTGSQNFLLYEKITQTLAGRTAILNLLPFSMEELNGSSHGFSKIDDYLFHGFYPRIYSSKIKPTDWYPNYIQTYIERDVRQIKDISNLSSFQKFLKLCAGRIGQILDLSSLANDCGITHNTAKAWISVLETSFIIFLLKPHYKNFNKRLIKMPKLYFYDTGLVCSLLGIETKKQISTHYLRGYLFENLILHELIKYRLNRGLNPNLFFWRDKAGHEVDCIFEKANKLIPIEIKSGKTILKEYFKNIEYWNKLSGNTPKNSFVIYGSDKNTKHTFGNLLSWRSSTKAITG
jgi:uncharacterized protein